MLEKTAEAIAFAFSIKHREHNYLGESFKVEELIPTSESTAIVRLRKSTGKIGIAFCYWINMNGGEWRYFFPTYDHCIGMDMIKDELHRVEKENFSLNFE